MSIDIRENVDLTDLNTLGVPATAEFFVTVDSTASLSDAIAYADDHNLPVFVLGGGSNIVIDSPILSGLTIKIELHGKEIISEEPNKVLVKLAAGENWDQFVEWAVSKELRGIEALSLIPGTIGAAPVQNVGGYGQEVSETITEVEVYDLDDRQIATLSNADCKFQYRDSIFKHGGKGRYIITAVTFQLSRNNLAPPPEYITLQAELKKRDISHPTVKDIRDAVISIRSSKLPDPSEIPTAGSFFHLPRISPMQLQEIQTRYPDVPHWPADDGKVKISAAWLIEKCGFKGKIENGIGIHSRQALCLINPGHRPASEVLAFRDKIIAEVQEKFGVTLQMEPELISSV